MIFLVLGKAVKVQFDPDPEKREETLRKSENNVLIT